MMLKPQEFRRDIRWIPPTGPQTKATLVGKEAEGKAKEEKIETVPETEGAVVVDPVVPALLHEPGDSIEPERDLIPAPPPLVVVEPVYGDDGLPDISQLTVEAVKQLHSFTAAQWQKLLQAEVEGKNRKTVRDYITEVIEV